MSKKQVKYIAYVASSIDGRIAESGKSGIDWTSKEDWNFFQNSLTKVDAVVVGHNTYKVSRDRLRWRNTIVLTSKVNKIKIQDKTIFFNPEKNKKSDLKKFIQNKGYKRVAIIGGGMVYDFCLRNKMMNELFVTIEPYVFTSGVQMFAGNLFKKHEFILESIKKLNKKGTILLHYKYQ